MKCTTNQLKQIISSSLFLVIIVYISTINCKSLFPSSSSDQKDSKWRPIRDFKPVQANKNSLYPPDPLKAAESSIQFSRPEIMQTTFPGNSMVQSIPVYENALTHEQLMKFLHSKQIKVGELERAGSGGSQLPQPEVKAEASFLAPVNVANQFIHSSRGLIDSISSAAGDFDEDYSDSGANSDEGLARELKLSSANNGDDGDVDVGRQNLAEKSGENLTGLDRREPEAGEAERKEQEAQESREAEEADKSALDEQQQQQREIIQAQARSEAKAIREQLESLQEQQRLQQKMLAARSSNPMGDFLSNTSNSFPSNSLVDRQTLLVGRAKDARLSANAIDEIQFSDLLGVQEKGFRLNADEGQQDSTRIPSNSQQQLEKSASHLLAKTPEPEVGAKSVVREEGREIEEDRKWTRGLLSLSDLLPAAQHHYGSHYGSLHGHQSKYYQYAESHKKGHYDSGFKRGNKKFTISGHSSQHKSHAEGHLKWKGKKGKGTHYWDFKHKDKKHHH